MRKKVMLLAPKSKTNYQSLFQIAYVMKNPELLLKTYAKWTEQKFTFKNEFAAHYLTLAIPKSDSLKDLDIEIQNCKNNLKEKAVQQNSTLKNINELSFAVAASGLICNRANVELLDISTSPAGVLASTLVIEFECMAYGTDTNCVFPIFTYPAPAFISTCRWFSSDAQSIPENVPVPTAPLPIFKVNPPNWSVITEWVSSYTLEAPPAPS